MDRQRAAMLVVAITATVLLLTMTGRHTGDASAVAARAASTEPTRWVGVSGDVRFSGLYPLSANLMTRFAIFLTKPDCALPLSLPDADTVAGNRLRISCPPDGGSAVVEHLPLNVAERLVLNMPLDLNRATAGELEKIPGIGPVMAERILRFRQKNGGFSQVSELLMVEGIGAITFERLAHYFQVTDIKKY